MDATPNFFPFSFSTVRPPPRSAWIKTPGNLRESGTIELSPRTRILLQDFGTTVQWRRTTSIPGYSRKLRMPWPPPSPLSLENALMTGRSQLSGGRLPSPQFTRKVAVIHHLAIGPSVWLLYLVKSSKGSLRKKCSSTCSRTTYCLVQSMVIDNFSEFFYLDILSDIWIIIIHLTQRLSWENQFMK